MPPLDEAEQAAVLELHTEKKMGSQAIARQLKLDRDMVRRYLDSVRDSVSKTKTPEDVALGTVEQRHREETALEATQHTNEVYALGREVVREYKAVSTGWGLGVIEYLRVAARFYEDNVERLQELTERNVVLKRLVEQAAQALKPLPHRRAMLERMIDKGHRFTREEVEFFLWGEVRGCIRCEGDGDGAREAGGAGAEAQDAVGGGGGSRPRAQPARARDGAEEGRGREDVPAQAEASVGGEADG